MHFQGGYLRGGMGDLGALSAECAEIASKIDKASQSIENWMNSGDPRAAEQMRYWEKKRSDLKEELAACQKKYAARAAVGPSGSSVTSTSSGGEMPEAPTKEESDKKNLLAAMNVASAPSSAGWASFFQAPTYKSGESLLKRSETSTAAKVGWGLAAVAAVGVIGFIAYRAFAGSSEPVPQDNGEDYEDEE